MGMHATVMGEEIKYSGLFAKTAAAAGIVVKSGVVQLTRAEIIDILLDIHRKLRTGFNIDVEYGSTFSFDRLAGDAHALALLYRWIPHSDQDTLTFA